MNIHEIPFKAIVSMPSCSDRLYKLQEQLSRFGINDAECVHPVPVADINLHEFPHLPKDKLPYVSQTLTLRGIIREAKKRGASSTWLMEDDAVFHPEFLQLVRMIRVPNNWKFFYLGGAYYENAVRINEALLQPDRILDLQSVVIAADMYNVIDEVFTELLSDWNSSDIFPDVVLADLHKYYPAYLCRPNLVWQSAHYSELKKAHYCNYKDDGDQWWCPGLMPPTAVFTFSGHRHRTEDGEAEIKRLSTAARAAVRWFQRVVLHTDTLGREMVRDIYFDEVLTTLDALGEKVACEGILCTLDTLSRQRESFVHLDSSVVLTEPLPPLSGAIVVHRLLDDAEDIACRQQLRSKQGLPSFVVRILADVNQVCGGELSIVGGPDIEFIQWFARLCLETAEKMPLGTIDAITCGWLIGACAHVRGKQLQRLSSEEPVTVRHPCGHTDGVAAKICTNDEVRNFHQSYGQSIDIHAIKRKYRLVDSLSDVSAAAGSTVFTCLNSLLDWPLEVEATRSRYSAVAINAHANYGRTYRDLCLHALERGDGHLMILQGNAVLHDGFLPMLCQIKVPSQWRCLYLSGEVRGRQEYVGRGLIQCDKVEGADALIIHEQLVPTVRKTLERPWRVGETLESRMAVVTAEYPTYLCSPPLVSTYPDA